MGDLAGEVRVHQLEVWVEGVILVCVDRGDPREVRIRRRSGCFNNSDEQLFLIQHVYVLWIAFLGVIS